MALETRCAKCSSTAVIKSVQIPTREVQSDGTSLTPSEWRHIVECPHCGTVEQQPHKRTGRPRVGRPKLSSRAKV
jgi:hypothetical protein